MSDIHTHLIELEPPVVKLDTVEEIVEPSSNAAFEPTPIVARERGFRIPKMSNTMRFVLRRVGFYLFTLWAAVTLNFFIPRMMPGNPLLRLMIANPDLPPDQLRALGTLFGLTTERSLIGQYLDYWGMVFRGDFGASFSNGFAPVMQVIRTALPWTIGLVGIATVIAFIIGTLLGTIVGWRRGSRLEVLVPITTFISTVPFFWMGLIIIAVFSVILGWFPSSHAFGFGTIPDWSSWAFIREVIRHGTLPAFTIVFTSLGGWILGQRNMMISVLGEDYVTVAQAKGLPNQRVMFYAMRNAILPQVQSFAMQLGFVVGGSMLLELVFSYPGLGLMMLNATQARDYPLMQGIFMIIVFCILIANVLADIAYSILDPRTRQAEG